MQPVDANTRASATLQTNGEQRRVLTYINKYCNANVHSIRTLFFDPDPMTSHACATRANACACAYITRPSPVILACLLACLFVCSLNPRL